MKDIKVYGHDHFGELVQMADGYVVYFEDHLAIVAELQEQVRALAAENHFNKLSISRVSAAVSVGRTGHAMSILGGLGETPATDHAIREIRARAVDVLRDSISDIDNGIESTIDLHHYCTDFAARIRSGEQP